MSLSRGFTHIETKTIYKNNVVVEIIMIIPQDKLLVRKVRSLKTDDMVRGIIIVFSFTCMFIPR